MFKRIKIITKQYAAPAVIILLALFVFGAITLPKLGSLYPFENHTYDIASVDSGKEIVESALYLPVRGLQYIAFKIDGSAYVWFRLITILYLLLSVAALYSVLSKWHTRRLAIAGVTLFVTSSYVLLLGRSGSGAVMYLSIIPVLLMIGTWLKSKKYVNRFPLASTLVAVLLYIPGAWLLILAPLIVFKKRVRLAWAHISNKSRIISIILFIFILAPLFYSFAKNQAVIINWLGYYRGITPTIAWDNLSGIGTALFIDGPDDVIWVAGTPVLDIFVISMFLLGTISYVKGHHPLRMRLLLGYALLSILLITLGIVAIAILIPLVFIVATNGIAKMLQSWFVVFPRNPIARSVGVVFIVLAVVLSSRYQLIRYYDAMPLSVSSDQSSKMIQYIK